MNRFLVCIIISVSLILPALAQQFSPLNVRALTTEDGLPQGFITGIIQDKQGFVWIATLDGLARYDGRTVKAFSHREGDSSSLAATVVRFISLDGMGNIWIQYNNSKMDILDPYTERVRHLSAEPAFRSLNLGSNGGGFLQLVFDKEQNGYIIQYDGNKVLPSKLYVVNAQHAALKEVFFSPEEMPMGANSDLSGNIWVATKSSLVVLGKHQHIVKRYSLPPALSTELNYGETKNKIALDLSIKTDIVIPTAESLWKFDAALKSWRSLPYPAGERNAITKYLVTDKNGTRYLVTTNTIYRINEDDSYTFIWQNDLRPPNITCGMFDNNNNLWVGTNTFGVRIISRITTGFHSFKISKDFFYDVVQSWSTVKVEANQVDAGYQGANNGRTVYDKEGNLWLINFYTTSIDGQSIDYNSFTKLEKRHATVYNAPGRSYLGKGEWYKLAYGFAFDDHNRCWALAPHIDKLMQVDLKNSGFSDSFSLNRSDISPGSMLYANKKMWIIYPDAVCAFDPQTKTAIWYKDQPGLTVFKSSFLLMATADPSVPGILWITSRGNGLIRLDTRNASAKAFTTEDGLPNNTVYCTVADKKGYLWCSSNKGIFRFDPRSYDVLAFSQKDGLQGNEFNRYQYVMFPDGRIAFGGVDGFTVFHPDSVRVDQFQPQIALTDVAINNEPLAKYQGWSDKAVVSIDTLRLTYDQNFINFRFAGLQYNDPEKLQYRYMLTGIDKTWVTNGTQNSANYTNLAPGNYDLKLNASNTAGIWSSHVKTIHIIIDPPWWSTWGAYALYTLATAAIILLAFRIQLRQAKAKQLITLKEKEAEQLKIVDELKSRFFSNVTHEFRTPLSLILSPVEQLQKQDALPGPVKKELAMVHRNANQLLRLINQLLDMNKIESGTMTVFYSTGNVEAFTEECLQSFKKTAAVKHIRLSFAANATGQPYLFDVDKFQKIIYNLLSNAIKFTPENGVVSVDLAIEEVGNAPAQMQLRVTDSGIGIAEDQLPFIFDRFYQVDNSATRKYEGTGIGLSLVRELLQLMKGSIGVTSHPGQGTSFVVVLPLQKAGSEDLPQWTKSHGSLTDDIAVPVMQGTKPAAESRELTSTLVMVVEDNEELREFIAQTLGRQYRTITASNGEQALGLARKELPDVIISDVMMPGMDGYVLTKEIKSNVMTSHIAVLLLTAKTAHDSVLEGLTSGADDYITKPFHFDELELRIHNILQRQEKLRLFFQSQLNNPETAINIKEAENPFISNLYTIIDAHLDDTTLSVEKLATKAAVSSRTLNRKLSSLVGLSANELIRQYRLKRSIEFLRSGSNVSEAAYSVGFETHSHFTISFKSFYGVTPSEYAGRNKLHK